MSHRPKRTTSRESARTAESSARGRTIWIAVLVLIAIAAAISIWFSHRGQKMAASRAALGRTPNALAAVSVPTNEVAQSLMVTVELDFGGTLPTVKDALKEIERRYEPSGERTFAILDADGWPAAGNKLHIQMHVSLERPGIGSLVFRRTGETLWKSHIVPAKSGPPPEKRLTIIMDDNAGHSVVLDGSKGATRVLDVPLQNSTSLVRDLWPDGTENEFTFIYSVCGCPVKCKVRRTGETTARTTELPVMFPDDPAALDTIGRLMGWPPAR